MLSAFVMRHRAWEPSRQDPDRAIGWPSTLPVVVVNIVRVVTTIARMVVDNLRTIAPEGGNEGLPQPQAPQLRAYEHAGGVLDLVAARHGPRPLDHVKAHPLPATRKGTLGPRDVTEDTRAQGIKQPDELRGRG